jgi:hypothetical protein
MRDKVDATHIKGLAVRFINLHKIPVKNELVNKQILRVGSALIFVMEWYDIHNNNIRYTPIWNAAVDVLAEGGVEPDQISKIVYQAEVSLTQKVKDEDGAITAARALADFVNPFGCNTNLFVKTVLAEHSTLQQSIGGVVFSLIRAWAKTERYPDGRVEELRKRCHIIDNMMSEKTPKWDKLPLI